MDLHCMCTRARTRCSRFSQATCGSGLVIGSRWPGRATFCWFRKARLNTYRVESPEGARFLTVTCGREFEAFVRASGRPAEHDGLPAPSGSPTPEQAEALARAARQYGIELVGPPLS